jgi:hypothetical protein
VCCGGVKDVFGNRLRVMGEAISWRLNLMWHCWGKMWFCSKIIVTKFIFRKTFDILAVPNYSYEIDSYRFTHSCLRFDGFFCSGLFFLQ